MTNFTVGEGRLRRPVRQTDYRVEIAQGFDDHSGGTVADTTDDANIITTTADYSDPYYGINTFGNVAGVELTALDATGVISGNRLSRVSNGTCRVRIEHPLQTNLYTLDMTRINDNVYSTLDSYVSGSLAKHISDGVSALIAGKTSADMPLFTTQNHASSIYVRNTSCWVVSLDLTAVSPWNSLGGAFRAGVAISLRHVLLANHYPVQVGTVLRFITASNVVVERTVTSIYSVPESPTYSKDVQIAKLDSDLPGTITPVKFLPANAYDYLPTWKTWKIPLIATNQLERMQCMLCNAFTVSPVDFIGGWVTTESPYATMYERVISGDSGSPAFFVINGEPVLICHWTYAGQGATHHLMLTEISAAMTSLGGGYTAQTVDLSSFTSYT